MKKYEDFTKVILTLYLIVGFVGNIDSQKRLRKNPVQNILDHFKDSIEKQNYGVNALVFHQKKSYFASIGFAEKNVRLNQNHIFNIGSLTKMFTSVLVLQEIENNKLTLDDTLGSFFSGNPNVDGQITIRQLLQHRSGLGEVGSAEAANNAFVNTYDEFNYCNLYFKIPQKSFNRDEKNEYCNSNYILLGYILEQINDQSYDNLLTERIFLKLKLKNSYPYTSKSIKNLAHPIFNGQDLYSIMNFMYFKNFAFSAGSIASNLNDLQVFFENLYLKETLVSKKTLKLMTTFDNSGCGLGIFKVDKLGKIYWGHAGDNLSYTTRNYFDPASHTIIIVISNHFDFPYKQEILEKLFDFVNQ